MALQNNNFSTAETFHNFISVYMSVNNVSNEEQAFNDIVSAVNGTADDNYNWFLTIDAPFQSNPYYEAWEDSPMSQLNYRNVCISINEAQMRLWYIYNNPNYNVNELQKSLHGEDNEKVIQTIFQLIELGFASSFDVTSMSQAQFTSDYYLYFPQWQTNPLSDTELQELASLFAGSASNIRSQVIMQYMGLQDAVNDGRIVPWNNFGTNYANLPTYQTLFKQQSYVSVDENLSMLSPSAYLVDLDDCADQYVLAQQGTSKNPKQLIRSRRPDITTLPLTADNTTSEIAKLQIVNEALVKQCSTISGDSSKGSLADLNTTVYPLTAPYNYYLEELRAVLNLQNSTLDALWKLAKPTTVEDNTAAYTLAVALERLGVFQGMYKTVLSVPTSDGSVLQERYGFSGDDTLSIAEVLEGTFIENSSLSDALYGDLSDEEIRQANDPANGSYQPMSQFYINGWYRTIATESDPMKIVYNNDEQEFANATITNQDRLNRLLRLSEATGFATVDLNWIITAYQKGNADASVEDALTDPSLYSYIAAVKDILADFNSESSNLAVALLGIVKDFGAESGTTMIQDLFGDIAPAYHQSSGYSTWNLKDLETSDEVDASTAAIMKATRQSLEDLILLGEFCAKQFGIGDTSAIPLNQDFLSAIFRVSLAINLLEIDAKTFLYLQETNTDLQAYGAPVIASQPTNGLMTLVNAFQYLQSFVSNLQSSDVAANDLFTMANSDYANEVLLPGRTLAIKGIQEIASGTTVTSLLTEQNFNDWLEPYILGPDYSIDPDNTIYQELVEAKYVDQLKAEDDTVFGGVVLKTELEEGDNVDIPESLVAEFNAMLEYYAALQDSIINGAFSSVLQLSSSTRVGESLSSWKNLLSVKGEEDNQANNVLHLFYTVAQVTMLNENVSSDELTTTMVEKQIDLLQQMNRLAILINRLDLSLPETEFILNGNSPIENPSSESQFVIAADAVSAIIDLHELVVQYADPDNNLLTFLASTDYSKNINNLAIATSWDTNQISGILDTWKPDSDSTGIELVTAMESLFNQAAAMDMVAISILDTAEIAGTSDTDSYESMATEMKDALYAENTGSEADSITDALSALLDESYRDVLAGRLLGIIRAVQDNSFYDNIKSFTDLSQFLLTDIQVTGKFKTSRVREAISAYMTYFHRIEMNLEPGLRLSQSFKENEYIWKQDYRVWEANRKVFLYPENYVQPDLRNDKSESFDEFSNLVNQATPTNENMESAFYTYLQNFQSVANLQCIDSYYDNDSMTVYFTGQTIVEPYEYYVRSLQLTSDGEGNLAPATWTPWDQVRTSISSRFVETIWIFNTVYLFWVEFISDGGDEDNLYYKAQIKYTFRQVDGSWSPEQVGRTSDRLPNEEYENFVNLPANHRLFLYKNEDEYGLDAILVVYRYLGYSTGDPTSKTLRFTVNQWSEVVSVTNNTSALNAGVTDLGAPSYQLLGYADPSQYVYSGHADVTYIRSLNNEFPLSGFYSSGPDYDTVFGTGYYFDGTKLDRGQAAGVVSRNFPNRVSGWDNVANTVGMWIYFENNQNSVELCLNWSSLQNPQMMRVSLNMRQNGTLFIKKALNDGTDAQTFELANTGLNSGKWYYLCFTMNLTNDTTLAVNYFLGEKTGNTEEIAITEINAENKTFTVNPSLAGLWYESYIFFPYLGQEGYGSGQFYLQHINVVNKAMTAQEMRTNLDELSGITAQEMPLEQIFGDLPAGSFSVPVRFSAYKQYIVDILNTQYLAIKLNTDYGENDQWRFVRLTSGQAAMNFVNELRIGGVDNLLDINTQLTSEDAFSDLEPDKDLVPIEYWPNDSYLDLNGANALYYWELFFFAPWTAAKAFETAGDYSNSNQWLKYVFNPSINISDIGSVEKTYLASDQNENDIYWRFIGLRSYFDTWVAQSIFAEPQGRLLDEQSDNSIASRPTDRGTNLYTVKNQALLKYEEDPFSPHAIAYLRPVAYQKALVMHTVKAKMEWADRLYTQATRDSILQAVIMYFEVSDLLGEKPLESGEFSEEDYNVTNNSSLDRSLESIEKEYSNSDIPEMLVGIEANLQNILYKPTEGKQTSDPFNFIPGLYFGIPENQQVLSFWNTVQQRLFNLRNSLDINGNPLDLNLFEPALNVMSLVSAVAGGASLSNAVSSVLTANVPIYRYSVLLSKAKEFAGMVSSFGQTLLATIEKKDAQELAQLELTQQATILNMTLEMKQLQIDQTNAQLEGLVQNMVMAATRYLYYGKLTEYANLSASGTALQSDTSSNDLLISAIDSKVTLDTTLGEDDNEQDVTATMNFSASIDAGNFETEAINLTISSLAMQTAATLVMPAAIIGYGVPNIFGLANGGMDIGSISRSIASHLQYVSGILGTSSGLSTTRASYKRRAQDWLFQKQLAEAEMNQIRKQYEANVYQLQSAQQDYSVTETQIEQNKTILDFYKSKFSSEELYAWMKGYLTGTYYQAYKLALSMGIEAQDALIYELGYPLKDPNVNIVNTSSWNNNYEGLLSGEMLTHSLNLLDKYYMEKNSRRLEVTKTFTLTGTATTGIVDNEDGLYTLNIINSEATGVEANSGYPINEDYNNKAYRMQVKMVTVTVPTLLAPYQDVQALLTHSGNVIYDKSNDVVRSGTGDGQQLAISMGQEDSGLFQANFDDPRYLPFEGTGVVGKWTLSFQNATEEQKALIANISDIIIRIRYTAEV